MANFFQKPGAAQMLMQLGAGLMASGAPRRYGAPNPGLGMIAQAPLAMQHAQQFKMQQDLYRMQKRQMEAKLAQNQWWRTKLGLPSPQDGPTGASLGLPGGMPQTPGIAATGVPTVPPIGAGGGGIPPHLLPGARIAFQTGGRPAVGKFLAERMFPAPPANMRRSGTGDLEYQPGYIESEARLAAEKRAPPASTAAMKNALALGLTPGTEPYNAYISKATVERPPMQINLADTEKVAGIKAAAAKDLEAYKALTGIHKKRLEGMQGLATQFDDLAPRLQSIVQGLESGRVETGPFEQVLIPFRQVFKDVGFTVDENLPQAEQVRSAMAYLTPRMRVVGSGQTSDMEMREFRKAGPQYANTTEGNILLGRSFLQIQARNKAAYNLGLKYYAQKQTTVGMDDYIEKQLGPVFPRPTNKAEHAALPPGVVYYHPELKRFMVKR